MVKLLRFLKGYGKETVLGPALKLLEALLELFVPLTVAALIDTGIAGGDREDILRMFARLLLLGLAGLLLSVTAQYFAAKAAVGFAGKIRQALFEHIQGLSYTQIDALGTSRMITAMTGDANQVQAGLNLTLRLLLRSPFVVGGAFVMACGIDSRVAAVFGLTILALLLLVFGLMFFTVPLYGRVQERLGRALAAARENLLGVRVIRAFGLEEEEEREFGGRQDELMASQLFVGKISALLNPLSYSVINMGVALMIWRGGLQVEAGLLTQGEVVALYNYMAQILEELVKLGLMIINLTRAVASGNRIQGILALPPGQAYPHKTGGEAVRDVPQIVFEKVGLTYREGSGEALSDISFSVEKGMLVGVIGGTGSGKTSLMNLLCRFYDATGGRALLEGIDIACYEKKELRKKIRIVPQKSSLVRGTIGENLRWGRKEATEEEMWQALKLAQAKELVEQKEGGLHHPVRQGGRNLSGGQKQRLAIARALVGRPEILILDDSSSALDYATDRALRKALADMDDRPTLFLVSQRILAVRQADLILVLEDGHLAGAGTHDELLASCAVYREIHASQPEERGDCP